jgi:hypothetical protein
MIDQFNQEVEKYVVWSKEGESLPMLEFKLSANTPCVTGVKTTFAEKRFYPAENDRKTKKKCPKDALTGMKKDSRFKSLGTAVVSELNLYKSNCIYRG